MIHTKNNFLICLLFLGLLLTGCNAEKRATRKAERKHDKSVRLDPMVAAKFCAARYSPIDSVNERIIYKPGRTIYDTILTTELEIFNDTVYLKEVKVVTVTKHDTIDRTRFERAAFKAALDTMKGYYEVELKKSAEAISDRDKKIASQSTTIRYLWAAGGIAWALIIVWVIKKVWWK